MIGKLLKALHLGRKKPLTEVPNPADEAPDSPNACLALAHALRTKGEPREAAKAYERALALGAPADEVHLQLGTLYAALAERERAITHLLAATRLAPGNADALCMLGTVMNDQLRFGEAATVFEQALALRPDFSEAHFNLGLAKFEQSDFQGAAQSFSRCVALNRGEPWGADREERLERDPQLRFEPKDMGVNEVKLRHDCEQLEYLLALGRVPPRYEDVLADYRALLAEIRGKVDSNSLVPFDAVRHPLVARTYKRPIHIIDVRVDGPLVNPALDFERIQDGYLAASPNIVAVDALLTDEALMALRRFCHESTIWSNIKPGYLGAYFYDGFCSALLLRLAWELRERFPRVMRGLPLQMMWGYKCDATLPGLGVHADAAAVNVNFWVTEDQANLDPDCGGLLVYPQSAPQDWGFTKFNKTSDTILRYLESTGGAPVRVPYRANRAVIFDSDLFHATDRLKFREGYVNRRINVTMLYGLRSA